MSSYCIDVIHEKLHILCQIAISVMLIQTVLGHLEYYQPSLDNSLGSGNYLSDKNSALQLTMVQVDLSKKICHFIISITDMLANAHCTLICR